MIAYRSRWRGLAAPLGVIAMLAQMTAPVRARPAPPLSRLLDPAGGTPRIDLLDAAVDRARGLARQAGTRPNPSIGVTAENILGQRPYDSFERAETTLQFSLPIELGAKHAARVAAGSADVTAAEAARHEGRLAYAFELALAYGAAEAGDRRVELAEDEVSEAANILGMVRALILSGREPRLRDSQAEAEVHAMRGDLGLARANRMAAYARLSALAGSEEPFTSLVDPLLGRVDARPIAGPADPLQAPAYLTARAERDAAEKRVMVERRKAIPDISVSVGARRLEGDKAHALTAGVTIPLNLFDANRGNIAASQADLRATNARMAQERLNAAADISSAFAELDAADAQARAAKDALAAAEAGYRLAHIAYQGGKSSLAELLTSRHALTSARSAIVDAAEARLRAGALLARLQGRTITGETIP